MLILTRRVNEITDIGQDIVLTVLDVGRHRVRLAIDAPQDVPVTVNGRACLRLGNGPRVVAIASLHDDVSIGDGLTIAVLGIKGPVARIGFEAPDDILIMRREVLEKARLADALERSLAEEQEQAEMAARYGFGGRLQ